MVKVPSFNPSVCSIIMPSSRSGIRYDVSHCMVCCYIVRQDEWICASQPGTKGNGYKERKKYRTIPPTLQLLHLLSFKKSYHQQIMTNFWVSKLSKNSVLRVQMTRWTHRRLSPCYTGVRLIIELSLCTGTTFTKI